MIVICTDRRAGATSWANLPLEEGTRERGVRTGFWAISARPKHRL